MTTPDVRTAAQEQYRRENWPTARDDYWSREQAFVAGAVWGAARVTPTREQLWAAFESAGVVHAQLRDHYADIVLALLRWLEDGGVLEDR